jgi:aminopeptidase N
MEPIGARQVFPSFDEPDLKATFTVTVAYKAPFTALSNMPIVRTDSRYLLRFFC